MEVGNKYVESGPLLTGIKSFRFQRSVSGFLLFTSLRRIHRRICQWPEGLGASSFRINVDSCSDIEQISQNLSPIFFSVRCKIRPQNCFLMLKNLEISIFFDISKARE